MAYLKLSISASSESADQIADALMAHEALSVSLEDGAKQPLFQIEPEDTPLWSEVSVQALFLPDSSPRDIIEAVKKQLQWQGPLNYKIEKVADEDWVRKTQQNFKPQCYAKRLWICPSWYDTQQFDGSVVRIDPGLAFGTGTHETTHLCLAWLAEENIKDKVVIDYGCGSGILALAALALGAKRVIAIDHDPQALEATYNNAKLNTITNNRNFTILHSEDHIDSKADIVIANILANPLIKLADTLANLCKSSTQLLLSGILESEQPTVHKAYEKHLNLKQVMINNGWIALEYQH